MNFNLTYYSEFCLNICKEIVKIFKENKEKMNGIEHKENQDVVTMLDKKIEEYVREEIQASFPSHSIYGEEKGKLDRGSDYQWVIDPIDGTVNFINKLEFYSFSIALKYKGKTIVGAVQDLPNNVTYHAIRGVGSFKNGKKIKINEINSKQKNEMSVSILLPHHYSSKIKDKNIELLRLLYENSLSVRVLTCHSLELIYLALGIFDATICIKTRGISSAASLLFLRELEGKIYRSRYIIGSYDVFGIVACNEYSNNAIKKMIIESGGSLEG